MCFIGWKDQEQRVKLNYNKVFDWCKYVNYFYIRCFGEC